MEKINNTDKICFNCKHLAWLVGVGQGIRCCYEYKKGIGNVNGLKVWPPTVPSKFHTCEHFEFKEKESESGNTN